MATQIWTDPTLSESVNVKDTHFEELMDAINDWEEAYGTTESHYTQPITQIGENINYSLFTEVDPNSHISKTSDVITFSALQGNEQAFVYKDYGISGPWNRGYFSKNYNQQIQFEVTSQYNDSLVSIWSLQNNIEDLNTLRNNSHYYNMVYVSQDAINGKLLVLAEGNPSAGAGNEYTDTYTISENTTYYLKITRDENVGAFGTIYCYVYSDSDRTNLLTTMSVTLHDFFINFRYLFSLNTYNNVINLGIVSGTISYLTVPPSIIYDTSVDEMQNALDDLKTLVDGDTFTWNIADPGDIITGGDPTDFVDQLRTNMEYFQDDNCYLCHTCDSYSACSCNATCHEYEACSCNVTCYSQGCSCNTTCYGYSACSCNNTCYGQTKSGCTCDYTCYGYTACSCNATCYGQSCSCNGTCHGYVACSCDSSCYGYNCSKCDITDYEYPWS